MRWEAKVTIDDGFPIKEVRIFNVEAPTYDTAIAVISAEKMGPKDIFITEIVLKLIPEGEQSRPDKMIYFLKEGYKAIPQSKKYLEMEAAHERSKQEANHT